MKNGRAVARIPQNSARIPRNSAERAFYTYANPKKRGIFRGKLSKKGTFGTFFNPNSAEFRGDFGNHKNRQNLEFWPSNQETTAFALDLRGFRPVSFVHVCSHAISPQNRRFLQERRKFQEKCKNCGPFRSKALCGTTFPPFLAFGLKNTRDGALTSFKVRVRTFGHFASGRVPCKSWLGGSLGLAASITSQPRGPNFDTNPLRVSRFFGLTLV